VNQIVVLIGPHSSGKTTLGRRLANKLKWKFDDEIGYRQRQIVLAQDKTQVADMEQLDFDQCVCEEEIQRDLTRNYNAVVETWHGGNLAYVKERSNSMYTLLNKRIRKHLNELDVEILVVPLSIQLSTLTERHHEKGVDLKFFHRVGTVAVQECEKLNLRVLPLIQTDDGRSIQQCVSDILALI